ncbi:MAG: peptidase M23 family protein [Anaerolineaceae bacterium]|nr:MAG: peptidase M23 family protein [Anaerolineaceae bacterium]
MKKIIPLFIVVLLALAGCNMPQVVTPGNTDEPPGIAPQPSATVDLANAVNATLTALAAPLPLIPEATGTPTPTSTPGKPTISVTTATNCRTGPGKVYDLVGGLLPGETTEIVGRDLTGQYWLVRNPDVPNGFCWLWGMYATPMGEYAALPIFTPPPTPTPAPGFSVSYTGLEVCAPLYAFRFQITNTGALTWESIKIEITDTTTATSTAHTLDSFRAYDGCILDINQNDLLPGEGGPVTNVNPGQLNYNPAGHSITAIITLCSANGLGGTCVSQTLNFTP